MENIVKTEETVEENKEEEVEVDSRRPHAERAHPQTLAPATASAPRHRPDDSSPALFQGRAFAPRAAAARSGSHRQQHAQDRGWSLLRVGSGLPYAPLDVRRPQGVRPMATTGGERS